MGLSNGGKTGFLDEGDLRGRTPAFTDGTVRMNWWCGSCFTKKAVWNINRWQNSGCWCRIIHRIWQRWLMVKDLLLHSKTSWYPEWQSWKIRTEDKVRKDLRGSCWIIGGAREAGLGLVVGRTTSIAKPGKAEAWWMVQIIKLLRTHWWLWLTATLNNSVLACG